MGAARRLHRARHIPFGVVTRNALGRLKDYRVVVLADVIRMDEEETNAFRSYVGSGGHLYASGRTSLLGTDGVRGSDFGLAEVFGGHVIDTEQGSGIYIRPGTGKMREAMYPEECLGYGFPVSADDGGPGRSIECCASGPATKGTALATLNLPYAYPSPGTRDGRDSRSRHSWAPWTDVDNPTIDRAPFGRGKWRR